MSAILHRLILLQNVLRFIDPGLSFPPSCQRRLASSFYFADKLDPGFRRGDARLGMTVPARLKGL